MFLNFPGKLAFAFMTSSIAVMVEDPKINMACYGARGLPCTKHHLTCSNASTISITNITFGYRQGCGVNGLSNCNDTTCCTEETGDCFLDVTKNYLPLLQKDCLNKSTCQTAGLRKVNITCNGTLFSAYSKIVYSCTEANTPRSTSTVVFTTLTTMNHTISTSPAAREILLTSPSTATEIVPTSHSSTTEILPTPSSPTTEILPTYPAATETPPTSPSSTETPPTPHNMPNRDTSDNGGIVGGVIGALLVLVAIVLIGLYLFKRKQRPSRIALTCVHNNKNESRDVNAKTNVGKKCSPFYNYSDVKPNIAMAPVGHCQLTGHYTKPNSSHANYKHI